MCVYIAVNQVVCANRCIS